MLARALDQAGALVTSTDPARRADPTPCSNYDVSQLIDHLQRGAMPSRSAAQDQLAALTERELDVARAVAAGASNQDISRQLFTSEATVKTHLRSIQAKLGLANRVEIAVLVTKAQCHLCHAARDVVSRVSDETSVPWAERLIEDHPDLAARFAEEIPVLMIDGVQRDFWQIDEARLRRALARRAEGAHGGPTAAESTPR